MAAAAFKDKCRERQLSPAKAAILLTVVVLAWGINWSVTKSLVQAVPPLWTAAIRSWVALAALLLILRSSGNLIVPQRADYPVVLSVALLHMTLFSILVAAGLRYLPASKGIVLGYTTPLWVAIAASMARTNRRCAQIPRRRVRPARPVCNPQPGIAGLGRPACRRRRRHDRPRCDLLGGKYHLHQVVPLDRDAAAASAVAGAGGAC